MVHLTVNPFCICHGLFTLISELNNSIFEMSFGNEAPFFLWPRATRIDTKLIPLCKIKDPLLSTFLFFFQFYFIFKLYIIVLVLPNIKMNPPQVYMYLPNFQHSSVRYCPLEIVDFCCFHLDWIDVVSSSLPKKYTFLLITYS